MFVVVLCRIAPVAVNPVVDSTVPLQVKLEEAPNTPLLLN